MRSRGPTVLAAVLAAVMTATLWAEEVQDIPMSTIGGSYRVLGRTGKPLGAMVTLQGVVVRGRRYKGDRGDHILQVQRINGRASQEGIEVPFRHFRTDFGEPYYVADLDAPEPYKPDPDRSLPKLEYGQTYEFWGFETGGFTGDPDEATWDGGLARQSAGFYFTSDFVVVKGKKLQRIALSPLDFLGQRALVHGEAINQDGKAWLKDPGWQIEVVRDGPWPNSLRGAHVAVIGLIGKAPNAAHAQIQAERAVRDQLEDQINDRVQLRGEARSWNSRWFLRYNGHEIILVENMDQLAAAHSLDLHTAIEISGLLRRELLDDDGSSRGRRLKERYIVRGATCRVVEDLLPIERIEEPCPWSVGTLAGGH